ncbi:MAG: succinylglutamate-semialdehyde dehydrogenase [Endozoicomonas sp. (ex Botrylloides leachii)]|nr:succinylglutamate-semialdehyde dehydrogenase [Endozoicomonas sp. (ex Botrylloides leachii)]
MQPSLFIHGNWQSGRGSSFQSVNPVTQEILWAGTCADGQQVNDAVVSARTALPKWAAQTLEDRITVINRFAGHVKEQAEYLAKTIARETGKPLWEARTEVTAILSKVDISIKAHAERTSTVENKSPIGKAIIRYKPHGVVAIFGPYNFPGHLPNGHIIPALLAGNSIVFKPSELTPQTAEVMIQLWEKAGLPPGVLNLVQGEKDTGIVLASHPNIDGLFFTGSFDTGKLIHQQFGGHPSKILALEMGGNNPLIITELENTTAAIHDTIQSAFITTGQRCTCARRLFVPASQWGDLFVDLLVKSASTLTVGDWNLDPQPFMGAMVSVQAANRILSAQKALTAQGGMPLLASRKIQDGTALITPSIIDVSHVENLPDKEYFGPLLQVIRYNDFMGAINAANSTRYGLSAGLFSDKKEDYDLFLTHIRAGIVNWNRPLTGASSAAPFGGIGNSGNHRPSAYYAADYCSYPVASLESESLVMPEKLAPGLTIKT